MKLIQFGRRPIVGVFLSVLILFLAACAQPTVAPTVPSQAPAPQASVPLAPTQAPPAPTQAPKSPVAVSIAEGIDPSSLDPAMDTAITSKSMMSNIYDTLIWRDGTGALTGSLATSWEYADPTTLNLKLRQGVKFHNGEELTADDVVFTFTRILNKDKPLPLSSYVLGSIASVDKVDKYTVRMRTPSPKAIFLAQISVVFIVSQKAVEGAGSSYGSKPVGTGPFQFVSWNKNEQMVLKAYDGYWRGKPKIDQLVIKIVPDDFARFAALKTGAVDIIRNLPPERVDEASTNPGTRVGKVHSARNMFLGMNTLEPPFNNVKVRQALNYAVDVPTIIKTVLGGHGFANPSVCNQTVTGYDANLKGYSYDPAKAKALLSEAGYPNGFSTTLWGPSGKYIKDKEVEQAIAAQLTQVGIKVTHNMPEWAEFWGAYSGKKIKEMAFLGTGNDLLDCDMSMTYRIYSKTGGLYYNTPKVDALIEQEQATVDAVKRNAIFAEIQSTIKEDAPWIFLYDQEDLYGVTKRINWKPRSDEIIWAGDISVTD